MSGNKINKLTPGANLMWESSRFMLPQHKDLIVELRKEENRQPKPTLSEEAINEIAKIIQESFNDRLYIKLTIYDPYDNYTLSGHVEKMDFINGKIKIKNIWIKFIDIIEAGY